ncbi:PREDICTED: cytochrome P450 72A15-like [Nelumbo nucifera]|uniref:Cytochrome P450 72A15-like n=1 Tax=Nelumbo nucifera TaxID=4432 RepID=A0A1U8BCF3_NELNU|nr:PREDICTED: cytochrome P450 72A15-like [Nelumbo nucifera]
MEDFVKAFFISNPRFWILLLLLLVVLFGCVKVVYSVWWRPKWLENQLKQQGIEGAPYKLLHGYMKDYVRLLTEACSKPMNLNHQIAPRVLPFIYQTVQQYGKICYTWLGTAPRLIISDPELFRLVFTDKSYQFQKPPLNPLVDLLQLGLSTLEGDKWAGRRKMISPAFHQNKLKGMVPAFTVSCNNLIERWKKLVSPQGSCELDVWPDLSNFSSDAISRAAFGSSYEEGKRIFELQKEQALLVLEAYQSLYFPGLRFIPTKKNRRRYSLDNEIKRMLRDMIHQKRHAMITGESSSDNLLGLMLQCSDLIDTQVNVKNLSNDQMTIEDLIEECKLFYFAGQETTAVWLAWTMIVLAMHQDWQEKAREEVLQICGKRTPDMDAISHLRLVTMILNEVQRLYPPVVNLFRYTHKKTKLRDISLPAGIELYFPTYLMHHDPDIWGEDAQEFRPERFSEGFSKASKDQVAFYPFGWGPRFCLGQGFAAIEAKMALAMILQHFSFKLSPTYAHAPYTVITLQPQHGAQLILHQL